ncbi:Secreted repeat of uncharacterised function [uncultured archaeon]|nr:Secreted repeat of uncharacterised function [uncultured archaeon]
MEKSISLVLFGIFAVLIVSGCTQQQPAVQQTPVQTPTEQPTAVQPAVKLSAGNYLVDSKGITLYMFARDVTGDSKCTGGCLNIWPIFYQENITISPDLNASDFGTITRVDGKEQTAYKGWPLYYYSKDVNPGDITGEGVIKAWFIARPYTVFLANKDNLTFLVDGNGDTLYTFAKDMPGVSNCTGACLKTWPAFYTDSVVAPSLLNMSDFADITNSVGSKQTTYKQMPLYYYSNDTKRGDISGQGVINAWFVAGP